MKKVTIDLNVILDMLLKRHHHEAALAVVDLCIQKKLIGCICAHEITTLAYFLGKWNFPPKQHQTVIQTLLDNFVILTADARILQKALHSHISDFEDAVIDESAAGAHADCIITGNIRDFINGRTACMTAVEAAEMFSGI